MAMIPILWALKYMKIGFYKKEIDAQMGTF
jgi:hypothetical protein